MTQRLALRPWQVWVTDFGFPVGTEQGGLRPAIVVGSEDHCQFPISMALVVPLTTRDRGLPHHVPIDSAQSGLKGLSWARTEDITAVSTERFRHSSPLGTLSEAEAEQVRRWVRRMLA